MPGRLLALLLLCCSFGAGAQTLTAFKNNVSLVNNADTFTIRPASGRYATILLDTNSSALDRGVLAFQDNGVRKFSIFRNTDQSLWVWDDAAGSGAVQFVSNGAMNVSRPGGITNVGAGQTVAAFNTAGALGGAIVLKDTGTVVGNGGAVVFGAASGAWLFASIKGFVTNGGGNSQGDIVFSVRNGAADATLSEAFRIGSNSGAQFQGAVSFVQSVSVTTKINVTGAGGGFPVMMNCSGAIGTLATQYYHQAFPGSTTAVTGFTAASAIVAPFAGKVTAVSWRFVTPPSTSYTVAFYLAASVGNTLLGSGTTQNGSITGLSATFAVGDAIMCGSNMTALSGPPPGGVILTYVLQPQ